MKTLLEKYLRGGITFAPDDGTGGGAPVAAAPEAAAVAPAAAALVPGQEASQSVEPAPAAATSLLGKAATAAKAPAASGEEPVKTETAGAYVDDPNKTAEENAAAKAEHDAAAAAKAAEKKEGEGEKPDAASYKIEVPDGFELDAGVEKQFRDFAAENGFTQDQVGKLKDMQIALYSKQAEALANQVAAWGNEVNADKEFGGPNVDANMAIAGAAINEFFSPKVAALLDKTGLGNHPELVRGFYRIGLTMGEIPTFNARTGGSGKLDAVSVLYGDK